MKTWKLSIKPDSQEGFDAFDKCKEESLLGLGWHHGYVTKQPSDVSEAKLLAKEKWAKWPRALKYFVEDMKAGDHVWIHQKKRYHLCRVSDDSILYGRAITPEYCDYDLGHARKAIWVEVPRKFVTGAIQRGTIAPVAIQPIKVTEREFAFNQFLFDKLHQNAAWEPTIDNEVLVESLESIPHTELFKLMSTDDFEDVVSAFLQDQGWVLIKSTCFGNNPEFECEMVNREGQVGFLQVKSGKSPDPLPPANYERFVNQKTSVFLFSTNRQPYPGNSVSGVHVITHADIFEWIRNNLWAITQPLKNRLWIHLQEDVL